jgi:hypothetical protein
MAGSYSHVLKGFSLIENLGDASEAMHEMLWLIESEIGTGRALILLKSKYYPMCNHLIPKDLAFQIADECQEK